MIRKDIEIMPREKAIKYGITSLTNSELLAIILNTGYKDLDVLELSEEVVRKIGKITNFVDLSINELLQIKGIGKRKALNILSSIELGKRILNHKEKGIKFLSPNDIFEYLKDDLKFLKQENFISLYVDSKGNLIEKKLISIGNINSVICDFNEIYKWYYKLKASGFYLVHNHPSLDPRPSEGDIKNTRMIIEQTRLLKITFIDHLIIGEYCYSFFHDSDLFRLG